MCHVSLLIQITNILMIQMKTHTFQEAFPEALPLNCSILPCSIYATHLMVGMQGPSDSFRDHRVSPLALG